MPSKNNLNEIYQIGKKIIYAQTSIQFLFAPSFQPQIQNHSVATPCGKYIPQSQIII